MAILCGCAAKGQSPPPPHNHLIAKGIMFWVDHPVVVHLLSSLGEEQRSAILAQAKALREEG